MAAWTGATAGGCGGAKQEAAVPAAGSGSARPLEVRPSDGASPIDLAASMGGCAVTARASLGASYRFSAARSQDVIKALEAPLQACLGAGTGNHGTAHVSGRVASDGKLSSVVTSPGGALSTRAATCLRERLEGAQLVAPEPGADELLLFIVSDCAGKR